MKPRSIFIALITVTLVSLIALSIFNIAKPLLEITINNDSHNPITTKVFVNGKIAAAYGEGARVYKSDLKYGKNSIRITGPFIKSYGTEIDASLTDKKVLGVEIEPRSVEAIISESIDAEQVLISKLRVFERQGAFIVYARSEGEVNEDVSYPSMYLYNENTDTWKDVATDYISNRSAYNIDREVLNYFSELVSD